MKKILSILLLTLLATGLFAQGAREIANTERPVKVISNTLCDDGYYELTVMDESGEVYIYHTSAETKCLLPLSSFVEGDVLAIKDNGISTLSLPPQLFATEIRNITLAKDIYGLNFKAQPNQPQWIANDTEYSNAMWTVELDDTMLSRFNYGYSYLLMENFKTQGLTLHAAYFAKGILDFLESVEPLIAIEDMDPYVEQYITDIYSQGVEQDAGPSYGSLDLIRALTVPEELADQFAYSYGYMIAATSIYQGLEIYAKEFVEGALTSAYGNEPVMTEEAMESAIEEYGNYLNEQYDAYMEAIQTKNLENANAFLADNKNREGVITLESGVQYEVITPGDGAKPTAEDTVIVNYTLRTLDGTIQDQGTEVSFPLPNLIPGFVEATTQMQVGESITAYIPPALGYGENGASTIEPNSLLIFDIELVEIVK